MFLHANIWKIRRLTRYPRTGIITWSRPKSVPGEKLLFWTGSSKDDLLAFPEAVIDEIGTALSVAQFGGKHPSAKPWRGEGPGVFEVVENHRGDTY
jgi:phage-related protein